MVGLEGGFVMLSENAQELSLSELEREYAAAFDKLDDAVAAENEAWRDLRRAEAWVKECRAERDVFGAELDRREGWV